MLQHMIEAQVLNLVFGCVDLLIRVFEVGFDDECRGISGFGGACMVRACVATFGEDVWYVAVLSSCQSRILASSIKKEYLCDDLLDKLRQTWINIVRNDANALLFPSI